MIQDVYTPDPGVCESQTCGVCQTEMLVERNVDGPRSFTQAMAGGKSKHDFFWCPHRNEDWHKQVVAIRRKARETPSMRQQTMLEEEADEIVKTRQATKKVYF